ncbi:myo-inositol catabolism protein IolH [Gordoniibacillus kamchatkensis]|uniref:Myo-inositol catabolism protein IolH n=1 Tax=Gordoniibacillus kamchatkensis TaxID=1590651 RepID=A0ABR5AKS5_9BACL|nr:sugar phosphate isomerase/epimerase family protein [Paenibacillus sp. VKM B-2647]KIL40962.1 myo-inositol catabolism protein IolH [Paenibacillus sp. VKM B-2647]
MSAEARIAVFPKGLIDDLSTGAMSLPEWIGMAATLEADGLELYPKFLRDTALPALLEVKALAERHKLQIPMMCASPDFTHPDPEFRAGQIKHMQHMIWATGVLGPESFRSCRVLSGQRRPDVSREDGIRWTVEAIRELLPVAEQHGVHLVMENHYKDGFWTAPEFAQKADVFLDIIGQIDSPWFGVNYDPSNAIVAGEDPLWLLRQVKHRVVTMHASDRHLKPGFSLEQLRQHDSAGYSSALVHGVIGEGLNDYDAIFAELRSVNFRGWISIEDGVNGLDEMHRSVAFIRRKISEHLL